MTHRCLGIVGVVLPTLLGAQAGRGPYARIAILRPHDGHTVEFEAGYIRHLTWHTQAGDTWVWYGWGVWAGERQRWFVYATFGHSAASLDSAVAPAEDERDNVLNVAPYVEYMGNALYEYLPALSRGTGEPQPTARLEFATVDVVPASAKAFEPPSVRGKQQCPVRHSGIGWWRGEPLRAMSACVRAPACRRFSKDVVTMRSLTRSTASSCTRPSRS